MVYHIPALLSESIDGLKIQPDGIYVDATFGGGGHSMEILKHLKTGKLIAFDQDEDAVLNIPSDEKFIFLNQNFRFLKNNLKFNNINTINIITIIFPCCISLAVKAWIMSTACLIY